MLEAVHPESEKTIRLESHNNGTRHCRLSGHGSKPRTPSEHPNPTTKIGSKIGGEFTYPTWDAIGFHPQPSVMIPGVQQTHGS